MRVLVVTGRRVNRRSLLIGLDEHIAVICGAGSRYFCDVFLEPKEGNNQALTLLWFVGVIFDHDKIGTARVFPDEIWPGRDILKRNAGGHWRNATYGIGTYDGKPIVTQLRHGNGRVDVPGKSKNTHPGLLMRGINRRVLGRKGKTGLQDLEEDEPQEPKDADGDSHFGDRKPPLRRFVERRKASLVGSAQCVHGHVVILVPEAVVDGRGDFAHVQIICSSGECHRHAGIDGSGG